METPFKAGFVNIFGPPNAGKSTLLNRLLGEHLAIVSPKVQTTRHRILGLLTEEHYQIIFSDTPGIITPKYELHSRMMKQVEGTVEGTDIALLITDIKGDASSFFELLKPLSIKARQILLLNKVDAVKDEKEGQKQVQNFRKFFPDNNIIPISATNGDNIDKVIPAVLDLLPTHPPYFPDDRLSDRPTRFFVSELIREQVYALYQKEVPYHTAVLIQSFEESQKITKIRADIIASRETQKLILLGKKGSMIKKLGTQARKEIEHFLDTKVYLELFVKVRPKWRDNDVYLREYGY